VRPIAFGPASLSQLDDACCVRAHVRIPLRFALWNIAYK
jgi:hypothetical protein